MKEKKRKYYVVFQYVDNEGKTNIGSDEIDIDVSEIRSYRRIYDFAKNGAIYRLLLEKVHLKIGGLKPLVITNWQNLR